MIKPGEIQKKANQVGVRDQQIEKDYILSWILWGVANHEQLSKILIFKGGTVLKKVYFEDYRFSEDLDFTLLNNEITNEQIFDWFKESFEEIKEEWYHVKNEEIHNIEINVLAIDGNTVIANWYLEQNNDVYDGIYQIMFNDKNECIYFKSWEMQDVSN